jgi:hypothetical protein
LLPPDGIKAAANLFGFIVECELRSKTYMKLSIVLFYFLLYYLLSFSSHKLSLYLVASASAFNDEGDSDYLRASVTGMEI